MSIKLHKQFLRFKAGKLNLYLCWKCHKQFYSKIRNCSCGIKNLGSIHIAELYDEQTGIRPKLLGE